MSNDVDPFLKNIFVAADRPLRGDTFMKALLAELQRVERRRIRRRMVIVAAAVAAVIGVTPTVLELTAWFVHGVLAWMDGAASLVYWAVSTVIGLGAIARTGRLGRR